MKKIYVLALAAFGFAFTANAQLLEDDMEDYLEGPLASQSTVWRAWSGVDGGADDGNIVTDFASSGVNSLLIDDSGVVDQLLIIPGAPTTGTYIVAFKLYIPAGRSFYLNMQAALTPEGDAWQQALMGGNVYFNCDGSTPGSGGVTGVIDCTTFDFNFTFPEDEFFTVENIYDLDAQTWGMRINGTEQFTGQALEFGDQVFEGLTAINFFSASDNNEGYIDDILITEQSLGSEDFNENLFSVHPNPVVNILNISSKAMVNSVIVYDLLGKIVANTNPNAVSPSIDMSSLASGTYLVNITIGDASKTIKVIK